MSNETKVSLAGICNVLQNAKKYEDPDRAFKVLWDGWRAQGLRHKTHSAPFYTKAWKRGWLFLKRHKTHSAPFYTKAWKRGWLFLKDANDFLRYIGKLKIEN